MTKYIHFGKKQYGNKFLLDVIDHKCDLRQKWFCVYAAVCSDMIFANERYR